MKSTSPRLFLIIGVPAVISVWSLAIRLVWEQTVLTWEQGAQMVGFSLTHSELGLILVLLVLISLVWLVVVLGRMIWKRNAGNRYVWILLTTYGLAWVLLLTPYGYWQRLFIDKFSQKQSIELMTYAAALGDIKTVAAFIQKGISINAQSRSGTALHGAAVQGQLDMMEFLINKGADVDVLNSYGDSPMENARQAWQRADASMELLSKHGAKVIRGSEVQRNKAIEIQVREATNFLDK